MGEKKQEIRPSLKNPVTSNQQPTKIPLLSWNLPIFAFPETVNDVARKEHR